MNIFDFYFKQIVTQSQMDWAFDSVQDAIHSVSLDCALTGILDGMDPQQHAPLPDKNVDIVGPGIAYDPDGQRIYVPDSLTVLDCSQDEFGTDTDPPTAGWWRVFSIFARFERDLTEPALDGNNNVVYTKQLESFEFFVRNGTEAATGPAAVPPPLLTDAVLVVDVLVQNGFTAILNSDMDFSRREDWVRFAGTTIGDRVYGTSKDAVEDLLSIVDTFGGALPFTFGQQWFGAQPVAGPVPPPTTIQTALDAIVYDLGQSGVASGGSLLVGALDSGAFPGGYVTPWASANIQAVLMSLGIDLDAHIGGALPQHPATAISFNDAIVAGYFNFAPGTITAVQAAINNSAFQMLSRDHVDVSHGVVQRFAKDPTVPAPAYLSTIQTTYFDKAVSVAGKLRGGSVAAESVDREAFIHGEAVSEDLSPWLSTPVPLGQLTDIAKTTRYITSPKGDNVLVNSLFGVSPASGSILVEMLLDPPVWYTGSSLIMHDLAVIGGYVSGLDEMVSIVSSDDGRSVMIACALAGNVNQTRFYRYDLIATNTLSFGWTRSDLTMGVGNQGAGTVMDGSRMVNCINKGYAAGLFGAVALNSTPVYLLAWDNSSYSVGNGNASFGASSQPTAIAYHQAQDHLFVGGWDIPSVTGQIFTCNIAVGTVAAGTYGPYASASIGSGADGWITDICSAGDLVWAVEKVDGSDGIINVWSLDALIDSARYKTAVGDVTGSALMNGGCRLATDGIKMWLLTDHMYFDGLVNHYRRAYVQSWYPDSLEEFISSPAAANKLILQPKHFVTPPDIASHNSRPNPNAVGRMLFCGGYNYTVTNFNDATWGEIKRVAVSPWK